MDRRGFLATIGATLAGCSAADDAAPTARPSRTDAASTARPTPSDTTHPMDEAFVVRDESRSMRLVVDDVATRQSVGGPDGETADGVFVLVELAIRNEGHAEVNVSPDAFALLDGRGGIHGVDEAATAAVDDGLLLAYVGPGLGERGVLAFDAPTESPTWTLRIDPARLFFTGQPHYVPLDG